MIRFIIKRREDNSYGAVCESFETITACCPDLEAALCRGGRNIGGPGYDISELIGVEINEDKGQS